MTYAEPNALPPAYSSWQEWRTSYEQHVADFNVSAKGASDTCCKLKIRAAASMGCRVRLDDEIRHLCTQDSPTLCTQDSPTLCTQDSPTLCTQDSPLR